MAIDAADQWPERALTPDERRDRDLVNQVVRDGRGPPRPAGTADRYRVPKATE